MTKKEELLEYLKSKADKDGNVPHTTYTDMCKVLDRSIQSVTNYKDELVTEKKLTYDSTDKRNIKIKIL